MKKALTTKQPSPGSHGQINYIDNYIFFLPQVFLLANAKMRNQ